jgi:hypothetical protein
MLLSITVTFVVSQTLPTPTTAIASYLISFLLKFIKLRISGKLLKLAVLPFDVSSAYYDWDEDVSWQN